MIKTLADRYPHAQQELKRLGFRNLSRMTFYFTRQAEMDKALGYKPGACSNWLRLKASPSAESEQRAADWLKENQQELGTKTEILQKVARDQGWEVIDTPMASENTVTLKDNELISSVDLATYNQNMKEAIRKFHNVEPVKPDPELKQEMLLMVSGMPDRLRKLVQVAEFMDLKVIVISDDEVQ